MAVTDATTQKPSRPHQRDDGRDHLNLAEFPISVLQRQQPTDEQGRKLDTISYESSRYNADLGRRVRQTVTLTTNSKYGLPTPADENLILALLAVAKRANDFNDPKVEFTPRQLFTIMGWEPNGRSYERLRDVLRRLKALTITYQNSWWDKEHRQYEEEIAVSLLDHYRIVRQVSGKKTAASIPQSRIRWSDTFFQSLRSGSLKRLNLDQFFALGLPTSQRLYRFLDKHFYYSSNHEFDLRELACGHVGLSTDYDIGELKRRLRPAIEELEAAAFIEPLSDAQRFRKTKPGVWRILFQKKLAKTVAIPAPSGLEVELTSRGITTSTAKELVNAHSTSKIQEKLELFDWLKSRNDDRISRNPAGWLVEAIKKDYSTPPDFKTKAQREEEARHKQEADQARAAQRRAEEQAAEQDRVEEQRLRDRWEETWRAMPPEERNEILAACFSGNEFAQKPKNHFNTLFMIPGLIELERTQTAPPRPR